MTSTPRPSATPSRAPSFRSPGTRPSSATRPPRGTRTPRSAGQLRRSGAFLAVALAAAATGCETVEEIVDARRDLTPHEAYAAALADAGLAETALGRAWRDAALVATTSPAVVAVPHREEGYLPPGEPAALGLRFALERGQRVRVDAEMSGGDEAPLLFLELFRVPDDPGGPLRPVQTADTVDGALVYEPWRDGEYVVRLQPELLRGGRYRITVAVGPSLDFPVNGLGESAVQSYFGAPRDGGVRDHHGVDIFAPRGTPVVAAAPGVVSRVRETSRGGRVVWLRDAGRNQSLYYAHLDRQLVADGQRVEVGDTLGLVGNTGNARTTPPHLHFGIYRRGEGPLDPLPFLRRPRRSLPGPPERGEDLGQWLRSGRAATPLMARPDRDAPTTAELAPATPFRVLAGMAGWYRVRLPDGRTGWVAASRAEPVATPVEARRVATADSLRVGPGAGEAALEAVAQGEAVDVLGSWDGYLWVEAPSGARGWVAER